jgi:hypothetical protein
MTTQQDPKATQRAAATLSELERAKRSLRPNAASTLIRVALAIVYMYIIVFSYLLLGVTGPVFISVLFLVAFFAPLAYGTVTGLLEKRRAQRSRLTAAAESRQEA